MLAGGIHPEHEQKNYAHKDDKLLIYHQYDIGIF